MAVAATKSRLPLRTRHKPLKGGISGDTLGASSHRHQTTQFLCSWFLYTLLSQPAVCWLQWKALKLKRDERSICGVRSAIAHSHMPITAIKWWMYMREPPLRFLEGNSSQLAMHQDAVMQNKNYAIYSIYIHAYQPPLNLGAIVLSTTDYIFDKCCIWTSIQTLLSKSLWYRWNTQDQMGVMTQHI